jgi:spermidine synthase
MTSHSTFLRLALLMLFAGSGCAALIYEIVWYQLLQLAIGSTAVSLAFLLATFMGGLCLGSLALPRLLPRVPILAAYPLRLYALLEAGIALFGLLELLLIPAIEGLYVAGIQHGMPGMVLRGLICVLCLLPPTILMGASLPAIARWAKGAGGAGWWAALYGANTLGAVLGALLAGFYLLRLYDIMVATFAAAAINVLAAIVSFALAEPVADEPQAATPQAAMPSMSDDWPVWLAIALSGATALGGEVVWTRLMGLMLGATTYAFSIILAVFLAGLTMGTAAGSALVRRLDPRTALGWCQMLAALGIAWTAYMIADSLPYWPVNPLLSPRPRFIFEIDLVRCVCAMLPPTLFWGASFPLAFAAARGNDPGRVVGGIYAANTFGAIFGALAVSLVLVPWIGTQNTERALVTLSAAGGFLLLAPAALNSPRLSAAVAASMAVATLLAWSIDAVPGNLIAYGRRMPMNAGYSDILYTGEGRDTSIAVSRWKSDGSIQFHVAGKVEASSNAVDMKLQRMLGHLPALAEAAPRSVLIVGFGAGVTAGSFTTYPSVKRIVICEMEPLIPPTSTRYFAAQNYGVAHDRRTQIVFDDARHFVLTTPEKFDVITSDPIHPFVRGSAALYSREYFEAEKAHLAAGGMVTQWVPLYESDAATVKSEIATFLSVFPNGLIFANTDSGSGYDLALIGVNGSGPIDMDAMQARLESPAYAAVRRSLQDVGIGSAQALLGTFIGSRDTLKPWLANAQINRDANLRLQYLAGLALNNSKEDAIYKQILSYRKLPSSAFTASPDHLAALFDAMRLQASAPRSGED